MATKPKKPRRRPKGNYCGICRDGMPAGQKSPCPQCRVTMGRMNEAHRLRLTAEEADAQAEARYEEALRKKVGC